MPSLCRVVIQFCIRFVVVSLCLCALARMWTVAISVLGRPPIGHMFRVAHAFVLCGELAMPLGSCRAAARQSSARRSGR
jgi:hypothetical protein